MAVPPNIIIWFVVDAVIMLTTIFGNLLTVFAIILCRKISQVVSNYFVFSLALSDLMVGVTIPYHFLFSVGFRLSSNRNTCILRFMLVVFACSSSIYSILAIATDRYIAIMHPLHYTKYVKKKIVTLMIIFGWILAFLTGAVLFFWNNWENEEDCSLKRVIPKEYLAFVLTPLFVSTWIGILIEYLKIWRVAATHAKRIKSEVQNQNIYISDSKSIQVVILILGCFSLCWLPYFVVVSSLKILGEIPHLAYEVTFTMAMINSCLNPLIYAWKNKNFRKAFWLMLHCKSPNQLPAVEHYITNHTPINNSMKPTLVNTSKSSTTSNQTELELYDGKSASNSENHKDWDQESAGNTTITTASSTLRRDIHDYI